MKTLLILGSKEYPMGLNKGYDLPSGGIEVYVQNIVKYLNRTYKIKIISAWFPNTKKYEKFDNIEVYRVKRIPGKFIRGITFPLFSFFKALFLDFDLIIANGPLPSFFAYILSKIKNKKYIAYSHGFVTEQKEIPFLFRKIVDYLENIAFSKANKLILVSEKEKKFFEKKLKNSENIFLLKHGVNFEKFSKIKRKQKNEYKNILFVGRLVPVKNIENLIKSLKYVNKKINCYIVGDGQDKKRLKKIAKEENKKIIFTGFKGDISDYLSNADVFVLPSISEASGIAVLEAMSAKVPVITTDLGLYPKDIYLSAGKGEPKEIAKSINKIFSNIKYRNKIIKNAYEYVKKYSFKNVTKKLNVQLEKIFNE